MWPGIGLTEAVTTLLLLNALFVFFVSFQIYEVIASYQSQHDQLRPPGTERVLPASDRRGIVVAVVLFMDWWVKTDDAGQRRMRGLHLWLIGLTGAVLVSAVLRMGFYVSAFGLTELRVYATAFMIWIAFMLGWIVRTVLRGKRRRFATPAVGALLAVVFALNVINPDGIIAAYNLDHVAEEGPAVDTDYLAVALSADAVPAILERIELIDGPCAQLDIIKSLSLERPGTFRSWNLARARAVDLLREARKELRPLCRG